MEEFQGHLDLDWTVLLVYVFGVPLFFLSLTWLIRWTIRGFKSYGF